MTLPALNAILYNGVEFGATTTLGAKFEMVPDESNRYAKWAKYTFNISGIVNAASRGPASVTIDDQMDFIRDRLTESCGWLQITGAGFGTLSVNEPGDENTNDVNYGPKPKVCTFENFGNGGAAKVDYVIETCIPCSDAMRRTGPAEWNYTISVDIDYSGRSVVTYSGRLQIAATRSSPEVKLIPVSNNVDSYKEKFTFPLPVGFALTANNWQVSQDRTTATFTVVHTELESTNIYPLNVLKATATHSLRNADANKFVKYIGTLNASYEYYKYTDRRQALKAFLGLYNQRIRRNAIDPKFKGEYLLMITSIAMSESLYGRDTANFSLNYIAIAKEFKKNDFFAEFKKLLLVNSMFEPYEIDWKPWHESVKDTAFRVRGGNGLYLKDEKIGSLCLNEKEQKQDGATRTTTGSKVNTDAEAFNDEPEPETSWLDYRITARFSVRDPIVTHVPLVEDPMLPDPPNTMNNVFTNGTPRTGKLNPKKAPDAFIGNDSRITTHYLSDNSQPANIVQRRSNPEVYLYISGSAMRAGYQIPPPAVQTVAGVPVVPANREGIEGFTYSQIGSALNIPIMAAKWRFRYYVPKVPTAFPLANTPFFEWGSQ